ncbi:MAG: peptidylprolyl isomerase [Salinivirgaceae bacterium]
MKKILFLPVFLFLIVSTLIGQKDVVLEIDDEKVSFEEFKRIYLKNNKDSALTLTSLEDYLEMFTNFKLKVYEAQQLGMDEQSKFKQELVTYRKQLMKPYLTDSATDEQLIRDAYERMKYIVRAQHILIKIPQNAKPADTVRIANHAHEILQEIKNGADFNEMAKKHSEDPSVQYNNGDLGYFSAFKMVHPFEDAAFNLEKGEVSDLVRTQFGYHIIKVTDKKEAPGSIEAAHIMIRLPQNATEEVIENGRSRINDLFQQLKNGEPFERLAEKFSEDPQTAAQGGKLPPFKPGRMLPSFEEKIYELEKGEFSEPFKTKVGWHIVKKIDNEPVKSLKEERAEIKRKLSKTARADLSRLKVIDRLKKEYNLSFDEDQLSAFYDAVSADSLQKGVFAMDESLDGDKPICVFENNKITTDEVATYIKKRVKQPVALAKPFLKKQIDEYIDKAILDYEKANLEDKSPDFAWLMKEYHDGILLFNITDSLVWQKAVKDTVGLKNYYNQHKEDYMWQERMQADIIEVTPTPNVRKAKRALKKVVKNNQLENAQAQLRESLNDSTITVSISSGAWEKGNNTYVDATNWKSGLQVAEETDKSVIFVNNKSALPAQPKELKEVRGLVTADYQNELEKQWIEKLRQKYDVKVHNELLNKLLNE